MSRKKPKHSFQPKPRKKPRTVEDPTAYRRERVRWSFEVFDGGIVWHDGGYTAEPFNLIAGHLKSFEQRTWGEVEANRRHDHAIPVANLVVDAGKRLRELTLEDNDYLLRLRFTGTQRVWGFRRGALFMVLWWDPQHKICPSRKKRT